jgi:hypothetical protein
MHDVTLQINLSPGDINYANLIVTGLVETHRASVDEAIAIVDCCYPQSGKHVRSDRKLSEAEFSHRVEKIGAIAENLKTKGYLDRIVYLKPNSALQKTLSHKYLGNWIHETHDFSGCGYMSYLAAFEVISTRYLLHYDGDMLLHQTPGYDWSVEAKNLISKESNAVAATPRISPPFVNQANISDAPSLDKTMHQTHPLRPVEGGWADDWFSTRCYLLDREKLFGYLPLLQGWFLINTLAARYLRRGYPRTCEMMLCKRIGSVGGWRLNLATEKAWLLHPAIKSPRALELLPKIQQSVQLGKFPDEQKGFVDIQLPAWESYLTSTS